MTLCAVLRRTNLVQQIEVHHGRVGLDRNNLHTGSHDLINFRVLRMVNNEHTMHNTPRNNQPCYLTINREGRRVGQRHVERFCEGVATCLSQRGSSVWRTRSRENEQKRNATRASVTRFTPILGSNPGPNFTKSRRRAHVVRNKQAPSVNNRTRRLFAAWRGVRQSSQKLYCCKITRFHVPNGAEPSSAANIVARALKSPLADLKRTFPHVRSSANW